MSESQGVTVAVIPARGVSRGLPGKHLRRLGGVPVISYTIRAALRATSVDHVIVSTDDVAIRAVAIAEGATVPWIRPAELSTDDAPTAPVIWHAITWWELEEGATAAIVVTLQPTSPLRTAAQIDEALAEFADPTVDSVVSVTSTGLPVSVLGLAESGAWRPLGNEADVRRQTSAPVYRLTGGIYATRREALRPDRAVGPRVKPLIVDADSAVDIDELGDLRRARRIVRRSRA